MSKAIEDSQSRISAPSASLWREPVLPQGTEVMLNAHTYTFDGGRVLMGGAPSRVAQLSSVAATMFTQCYQPEWKAWNKPAGRKRLKIRNSASRVVASYLVSTGLADPDPRTLPQGNLSEVTVVIPGYGRVQALRRLLDSLRAELPGSEIIVVDDASGAESPALAQTARHYDAAIIVLPENSGPATARNTGLAEVNTRYVLFVDTDVVLRPGSMNLLLRHFADPGLAAVAPRVLGLPAPRENWVLRYEEARSSLDHGPNPSLVEPHSPLSWLSTSCLVARTESLGEGLTSGMRVGEDVDLVWRLAQAGWRVRYEPRAAVDHAHRYAMRKWLSRKYLYGTGAGALGSLHGNLVAPAVMSPWAGVFLAGLAIQRRWSLVIAIAAAAVATVVNFRKLAAIKLDRLERGLLSLRLTRHGVKAALSQGLSLTLRHWWPATVAVSTVSLRARRLLVVAGVVEAVWEYRRLKPRLDLLRFSLARRLDDAAYGFGVWVGAVRFGSLKALLPARPRSTRY